MSELDSSRFIIANRHIYISHSAKDKTEELLQLEFIDEGIVGEDGKNLRMFEDSAQVFALGVTIGLLKTNSPKQCNVKASNGNDVLIGASFRDKDKSNVLPILVVARHQDLASEDVTTMAKPIFDKLQDYFEVGIVELWNYYKDNENNINIEELVDSLLNK